MALTIGATALLAFGAGESQPAAATSRELRAIGSSPADKPAFDAPPAGFNAKRDGVLHGKLEMVECESKTVGTKRRMQVYTPPQRLNFSVQREMA